MYSNEIEGVHSTRRQIEEALAANDKSAHAPFVEFAQLYLNLSNNPPMPQSLQDIRRIYDSVVADAISPKTYRGWSVSVRAGRDTQSAWEDSPQRGLPASENRRDDERVARPFST